VVIKPTAASSTASAEDAEQPRAESPMLDAAAEHHRHSLELVHDKVRPERADGGAQLGRDRGVRSASGFGHDKERARGLLSEWHERLFDDARVLRRGPRVGDDAHDLARHGRIR